MSKSNTRTKPSIKNKKKKVLKIKNFGFAPYLELENAVKVLNTQEPVLAPRKNLCRSSRRKVTDAVHLSNIHYCELIKNAIVKHEWKNVLKLLLAYIDEPRSEKHTAGAIFKYIFILLLNDPVARNLDIMNEFLQLALACHTQEQREEFLNMITSISNVKMKQELEIIDE